MGTRTYSRRGVLTAQGRARAATQAGNLNAVNIFGDNVPEAAPAATVTQRPATPEDVRMIANYNAVMDKLEGATDLELSGYSQDKSAVNEVLALAAARRLSTRRWSETFNPRLQDAENRFPEIDPVQVESSFGSNINRLAGAVQVFSDYVGDYMTGPGARSPQSGENVRVLLTSVPRDFGAINSFLEQVYDMERKARREGRKKFNKSEREQVTSLMKRVSGRLTQVRRDIEQVANDNAFNAAFDQPTVRDVSAGRAFPVRPLPEMKTYASNVLSELYSAMQLIETKAANGTIANFANFT